MQSGHSGTHGSQGTVGHTAVRAQWHTRQSGHSRTHGSQGTGAQWHTLGHSGTHCMAVRPQCMAHAAVRAQWHTLHAQLGHSAWHTRQLGLSGMCTTALQSSMTQKNYIMYMYTEEVNCKKCCEC